jgi:hypothetical protein
MEQLPTHCFSCGVLLEAGATAHKEKCAILAVMRKHFGDAPPGVRAAAIECMEACPMPVKSAKSSRSDPDPG